MSQAPVDLPVVSWRTGSVTIVCSADWLVFRNQDQPPARFRRHEMSVISALLGTCLRANRAQGGLVGEEHWSFTCDGETVTLVGPGTQHPMRRDAAEDLARWLAFVHCGHWGGWPSETISYQITDGRLELWASAASRPVTIVLDAATARRLADTLLMVGGAARGATRRTIRNDDGWHGVSVHSPGCERERDGGGETCLFLMDGEESHDYSNFTPAELAVFALNLNQALDSAAKENRCAKNHSPS